MSSSSSTPSVPNINVPIRIEPIDEYKIQEITYDGQEKYIPPLSMSENLSQLIQKIDFSQPIDELKDELEQGDDGPTAEAKNIQAGSSWPFDSMRSKLRLALTEICVLHDVLSIAKERKYMVFDTVNQKQVDQRPIVGLLGKKMAFGDAARILIDGASTLRGSKVVDRSMGGPGTMENWTPIKSTVDECNFYEELVEMRKNWRLKSIGNIIMGDLSYFRPVGHRFMMGSCFKVIRTTPETKNPLNQAITVEVPKDLEGRAHIQVSIIKNDDISLVDLSTSAHGRSYEVQKGGTWQEKLESAQNVLFCKELFSHLAQQTVQYQFTIPTTVTGNQIILALFPDIKLYITLVHKTPHTRCSKEMSEGMIKLQKEHKPVLEHSLHQMLRDYYANMFRKMQARDVPKEVGPCAIDKQTLFEISRQESSLEKVVQQAQHLIMRQQTMEVIDSFAARFKDPMIISHWFCLNSPTTSIARVDIVSHNNEVLGRSHMLIYIGTRQLRVITRDCKNLVLGYEADELKHLLVWQSCLHQFIASDKLSKLLGWYTLILNYSVNVTRRDLTSTAFSLVICSSNCKHLISIKSGPQFGLVVSVAHFKETTSVSGMLNGFNGFADGRNTTADADENTIESILSPNLNGNSNERQLSKLQDLVGNFREIEWNKMQGKDFLTKLELLMAALTDLK